MFGTLKSNPNGRQLTLIELADGAKFMESGLPQYSACQMCRERKLRCDGRKPCCERCINCGIICHYTPSNPGRRRKRTSDDAALRDDSSTTPFVTGVEAMNASSTPVYLPPHPGYDFGQTSATLATESDMWTPGTIAGATTDELDLRTFDGLVRPSSSRIDPMQTGFDEISSGDWMLPVADLPNDTSSELAANMHTGLLTPCFSSSASLGKRDSDILDFRQCNCVDEILVCLSELDKGANGFIYDGVTAAINLHRQCLRQCQILQVCENCQQKPSTITLLILAYERLVEFCDGVFTSYLDRRPRVFGATLPDIKVGDYQLISRKELLSVLENLMSLCLEETSTAIEQTAQHQSYTAKESHRTRLRCVDEQLKNIITRFRC